jgi:hypothetical protein
MSDKTITFKFSRSVALNPIFYDEQWYRQLLADGHTHEGALREMLRAACEEDPTEVWFTLTESEGGSTLAARADVFADHCFDVRLTESGD